MNSSPGLGGRGAQQSFGYLKRATKAVSIAKRDTPSLRYKTMTQYYYDTDVINEQEEVYDVPSSIALGYVEEEEQDQGDDMNLPTEVDLGYGIDDQDNHCYGTTGSNAVGGGGGGVAAITRTAPEVGAGGGRRGGEQRRKQLKPRRVSILGSPDDHEDGEGNLTSRRRGGGGFVSDDSSAEYSIDWTEEEKDEDDDFHKCRWNDQKEIQDTFQELTYLNCTGSSHGQQRRRLSSLEFPNIGGDHNEDLYQQDMSCSYNTTGTATTRHDSRQRRLSSLGYDCSSGCGGDDTTCSAATNTPPVLNLEYGNPRITSRRLSLNLQGRRLSQETAEQRRGSLTCSRLSQRRASMTTGGGGGTSRQKRRTSISAAVLYVPGGTSDNQSTTVNRPTRRISIGLSTPTMSRRRSHRGCNHDRGSLDWWSDHVCTSTQNMPTFSDITTPANMTISISAKVKPQNEEVQGVLMASGSDRERPTRRISLGYETPTMGLRRRTSSGRRGSLESLGYATPTNRSFGSCTSAPLVGAMVDGHASFPINGHRRMSLECGVTGTPRIATFRRCVTTPAGKALQGIVMGRRGSDSSRRPIRRVSMGYETPTMGLRRLSSGGRGGGGSQEEESLLGYSTPTRSFGRSMTTGTMEYHPRSTHSSRRMSLGCGVMIGSPTAKSFQGCVSSTGTSGVSLVEGSTSAAWGQTCSPWPTNKRSSLGYGTQRMSTSRSNQRSMFSYQASSYPRTPHEHHPHHHPQQQRTLSVPMNTSVTKSLRPQQTISADFTGGCITTTSTSADEEQQPPPPISEIIFARRRERRLSLGLQTTLPNNTSPSMMMMNTSPIATADTTSSPLVEHQQQSQRLERRFSIKMSTPSMFSRRRRAASLGHGGGGAEGTKSDDSAARRITTHAATTTTTTTTSNSKNMMTGNKHIAGKTPPTTIMRRSTMGHVNVAARTG